MHTHDCRYVENYLAGPLREGGFTNLNFVEAKLDAQTAELATNSPVVCLFVNDQADAKVGGKDRCCCWWRCCVLGRALGVGSRVALAGFVAWFCCPLHKRTRTKTPHILRYCKPHNMCFSLHQHHQAVKKLAKHGVKLIAMRCAGFDRVDLSACAEHGIKVARVPTYSPTSVAEHAVSLLMALNRCADARGAHGVMWAFFFFLRWFWWSRLRGWFFRVQVWNWCPAQQQT